MPVVSEMGSSVGVESDLPELTITKCQTTVEHVQRTSVVARVFVNNGGVKLESERAQYHGKTKTHRF
jgi:hypothetical protein